VTIQALGGDTTRQKGGLDALAPERLDEVLTGLPQRPLAVDEKGEVRLSLAGAQSKLPVIETQEGFALPLDSNHPTTHILKPEPERFPGLVDNEFFCMRLAREVGLQAAAVERAETVSGLPYLVVERYDRDHSHEPLRRLHQEDLCQALGKLHVEKYQQEGGPSVVEAMTLIDKASSAPARDRQQFFLALVFNVLIGNCDAHGKNYSLLYDSPAPSLAPLYDLLSTAIYPELTQRLSMSIDGATMLEDVGIESWEHLASEVGFAPRFLSQRMQPFVAKVFETCMETDLRFNPAYEDISNGLVVRAQRFHPTWFAALR
jgi:serine/threonine-protein kinase HipA